MDIAKIRKMAKEKEASGRPAGPAGQGSAEETPQAPESAPVPEEVPTPGEGPREPVQEEAPGTGDEGTVGQGPAVPAGTAPPAGAKEDRGIVELLTFTLSQEEFAFRVPEVEEIIRHQKITGVPTMPGYVCGITSLRGKIIPVIDLRTRLMLREEGRAGARDAQSQQKDRKILILAGPRGLVGATIDRVLGVVRISEKSVFDPPGHLTEEELHYIEGVVTVDGRFISIIRAEAALTIEVS